MPQQEPWFNENRQQLLSDLLRNSRPSALVENAATLGSGLVAQAGTGLGVGAGMVAEALRGRKPDLGAAVEATQGGAEKFTYMPRTEGGQELLRGLGTVMEPLDRGMQAVGQKAADVTGSPAVGAAVYTGLNVLDPEMMLPAKGASAALRGAQGVAREAAKTAVPMSEALRNVPQGQRGAYSLEDLSAVEGDYGFKSPTLDAFAKLKKQEQRVPGKQLLKALQREGAKPDELKWAGLDRLLNTDEVVDAAQVRAIAERNVPQMGFETTGGRPEPIQPEAGAAPIPQYVDPYEGKPSLADAMDEDSRLSERVDEYISERVYEDDDLEYAETWTAYRGSGRHRESLGDFASESEADDAIQEARDAAAESEVEHYLENIDEYLTEEELAAMDDGEKQYWAEERARESADDETYSTDSEVDVESDPTNLDAIRDYWETEVHSNPADHGFEGDYAPTQSVRERERRRWYEQQGVDPDTLARMVRSTGQAPSYGEYTVGGNRGEGSGVLGGAGKNYGVTIANVLREGRFGRGQSASGESGIYGSMIDEKRMNPALANREAERSAAREALPDIEQARGNFAGRGTHYGENVLHTRETDRPAPAWGTTQVDAFGNPNPMRMIEEVQSDPYQRGRKIGFLDPEKSQELRTDEAARVEAFQREALAGLPLALREPHFEQMFDTLRTKPFEDQTAQEQTVQPAMEHWQQMQETNAPPEVQYEAAKDFWYRVYLVSPDGSPAELRAKEIHDSLENLPGMESSPFDKMIPEGPFMDTDQYTALGVRDALRRGIRQGQQYFAFTPGETHARRYGSESIQWGTSKTDPDVRQISTLSYGDPGKGPINERVRVLAEDANKAFDAGQATRSINLSHPHALENMQALVQENLDYGMHEYPDPHAQRAKRAEMLVKMLRENPSGEYTPREFGFADVYDRRVKKALQSALREAGSKAQIRDIEGQFGVPTFERVYEDGSRSYEVVTTKDDFDDFLKLSQDPASGVTYHPPTQYAIEADPALAQHAKRGFKYPY
jgi:hypothetical protein